MLTPNPSLLSVIHRAVQLAMTSTTVLLGRGQVFHLVVTPPLALHFTIRGGAAWLRGLMGLQGEGGSDYSCHAMGVISRYLTTEVVDWRHVPEHYVLSTRDPFIPAQVLTQWIQRRRAHGLAVTSRIFTDTSHVQHFRHHPQEYSEDLEALLAAAPTTAARASARTGHEELAESSNESRKIKLMDCRF